MPPVGGCASDPAFPSPPCWRPAPCQGGGEALRVSLAVEPDDLAAVALPARASTGGAAGGLLPSACPMLLAMPRRTCSLNDSVVASGDWCAGAVLRGAANRLAATWLRVGCFLLVGGPYTCCSHCECRSLSVGWPVKICPQCEANALATSSGSAATLPSDKDRRRVCDPPPGCNFLSLPNRLFS